MNDEDIPACFQRLIEGHNVWVWVSHGFRHIVRHCLSHYTYIKAAGGLVSAPDRHQLLIFRDGQWDIPKGMVEPGETLKQAAIREVMEETGIKHLTIDKLILKTYHIYNKYGGWHLKQTSWYTMHTPIKSATTPQSQEGITQAVWLSPQLCYEHLTNSYASLRLVADMLSKQMTK